MKTSFREANLGDEFSYKNLEEIRRLIGRSTSFTLSGMPGVGGSIFLRFLATRKFAHFIYLDTYFLPEINKTSFYKLLAQSLEVEADSEIGEIFEKCILGLQKLLEKNERVVFIFNRFDQLREIFDDKLFTDLINLHNLDEQKVVFIFTANKLDTLSSGEISADKMNLMSKIVYLKPFEQSDLRSLIKLSSQEAFFEPEFIDKAISLSGGHYQLLQLLLKSERLEMPFIDQFVRHQLKEIYGYLSYSQKKDLEKIALGKKVTEIDEFLINVGIVKQIGNDFELFTPLLTEFLKENVLQKFSFKEARFFKLLKENLGKVVETDKIFSVVWAGEMDEASEWALSSLLYRLRKHPLVKNQGFIIESYKKIGYRMIKN